MDTTALIKKLVSFPSVTSDKKAVNACSEFVYRYLKRKGLFVKRENCSGYTVVYAATHRSKKSDVLFNAHLDVVSAQKTQFRPARRGRRLLGRGALDCKGTAAVIMNLLSRLNGRAKAGAVFSADEETGGFTTLHMVKKGYAGKLTVVLDGNIDRLVVAQKGILSCRLVARGRACHASTPWRGENAVENLIAGYLKIKPLFKKASETDSWKDTCAATIINAGTVSNQVPDRADMVLNIRFTERTDPRRLLKKIKKRSGLRTELQLISPFVAVPKSDRRIRLFHMSMRRRLNPAMVLGRMNGATDARYFVRHTPSVVITGLKGGGAHSIHEWLDLRTVPRMERALFDFIMLDWPQYRSGR